VSLTSVLRVGDEIEHKAAANHVEPLGIRLWLDAVEEVLLSNGGMSRVEVDWVVLDPL
jgi:hypothetical protein